MVKFWNVSQLNADKVSQKVTVNAWINKIRKLGKLLFLVVQDSSGEIQIIAKDERLINSLKKFKRGDLLSLTGLLKLKNDQKGLEIILSDFRLINSTADLPFEIKEEVGLNEDTKYRYRYLDLRRPNSSALLKLKSDFLYHLRNFLHREGFWDIETPILSQKSPEGASCFVVPANLDNHYYTLAQSPQIFKQLLMVGGIAKYYQIAKSFRNEDARSNRQIEFSQLDLEQSFTTAKEIRKLVEKMLKYVLKRTFNRAIKTPFKVMSYAEVMVKYGTDKPDLRKDKNGEELSFLWIVDWPLFEYDPEAKKYQSIRHPFTTPKSNQIEKLLTNKIDPEKVLGEAFDLVCNGEEILSGSIRIHDSQLQKKVLELLGYQKSQIQKNFGYFLQALEFAAPPHGGIGFGIDRMISKITEVKNLKELIAFPKNIDGSCSLTGAPDYYSKLELKLKKKK